MLFKTGVIVHQQGTSTGTKKRESIDTLQSLFCEAHPRLEGCHCLALKMFVSKHVRESLDGTLERKWKGPGEEV